MQRVQKRVLMSVIFMFCLWGAVGVATGALLPNIRQDFTLTLTGAGLLISYWSICNVAGSWISVRLVEKFRLNSIFLIVSGLSSVFLILLFQGHFLLLFVPAFGFLAIMMGISLTIGHSLIGASFPNKRTSILSVLDMVFTLGSISAPLGIIFASKNGLDWRAIYLALGLGFVLLSILIYCFVPNVSSQYEEADMSDRANGVFSQMRQPYLIMLGLLGLFLGTIEWAQNTEAVNYSV